MKKTKLIGKKLYRTGPLKLFKVSREQLSGITKSTGKPLSHSGRGGSIGRGGQYGPGYQS